MRSPNGKGEEGVFRFVSHCVKTDMGSKIKAKHKSTMRQSMFNFEENFTHSRAPSQMSCFSI